MFHCDDSLPGPWFNINMSSYQYRKFHCGDKTTLRPSYLHNGISYTGKTTSSYWISPPAAYKSPLIQGISGTYQEKMPNVYPTMMSSHGNVLFITLHWRHNDHDGISNRQPRGCLLNRLFRRRWKKTSKLHVNSPQKGPVTRKMFPFDDAIMTQLVKNINLITRPHMICRNHDCGSLSSVLFSIVVTVIVISVSDHEHAMGST